MYDEAVCVRYHDTANPTMGLDEQLEFIREERLPLPVVFLNGRLLYAGRLDPLQVVVDVAQEVGKLEGRS